MPDSPERHIPALPHGPLVEVLPDVFFVTGTREWDLQGARWQFSRNMTVVREQGRLTLFNALRLTDGGLAELDQLGEVSNVVQLGGLHGVDDGFYRERYGATYWAQGGAGQKGVPVDRTLTPGGVLPIDRASLFIFETTKISECTLLLNREGGIMIACDALQNYVAPDEFFNEETARLMTEMGFFTRANVGPVWMEAAEPKASDFARLKTIPFRHALCGHGEPLLHTAGEEYAARFARLFGV